MFSFEGTDLFVASSHVNKLDVLCWAHNKAHSRPPEKANVNLANKRKHNFYKRRRHESRHRCPAVKIVSGPLPINPALVLCKIFFNKRTNFCDAFRFNSIPL